jgi:hypothetical protein
VDEYITRAGPVLEKNGFFEVEIARQVEQYGGVVHAFSTYESRHKAEDKTPFVRGINSIQLFNDGQRWWVVTILWEGVLVSDLLADAGTNPNATTVIFTAADGYSTSLPFDYVAEREILLAYAMNNVTLPAERGFPFQIVAEDRWGYKWAKWITGIELSNDASYRGYWESRGYANNGSLARPFIEGR